VHGAHCREEGAEAVEQPHHDEAALRRAAHRWRDRLHAHPRGDAAADASAEEARVGDQPAIYHVQQVDALRHEEGVRLTVGSEEHLQQDEVHATRREQQAHDREQLEPAHPARRLADWRINEGAVLCGVAHPGR